MKRCREYAQTFRDFSEGTRQIGGISASQLQNSSQFVMIRKRYFQIAEKEVFVYMVKKVLVIVFLCLLLILGGSGTVIYYHDSFIEGISPEESTVTESQQREPHQISTSVTSGYIRRELLESQEESGQYDFNALFQDCYFVGDSRTVGMAEQGFLEESRICAEIGVRVDHLDWHLEEVVAQNPAILIISYGVNDAATYHGDVTAFIQRYGEIVEKLQDRLPETIIYINSILPVKNACTAVSNDDVEAYNEALETLCNENHYYFIDNSRVAREGENLYAGDGLHFLADFYPIWLCNIAEALCDNEESH